MPRIVVETVPNDTNQPVMMMAERVRASDLENDHFAALLLERLGWAIADAKAVEGNPANARRG